MVPYRVVVEIKEWGGVHKVERTIKAYLSERLLNLWSFLWNIWMGMFNIFWDILHIPSWAWGVFVGDMGNENLYPAVVGSTVMISGFYSKKKSLVRNEIFLRNESLETNSAVVAAISSPIKGEPGDDAWMEFYEDKLNPKASGHQKYMNYFIDLYHNSEKGSNWRVFFKEVEQGQHAKWKIVIESSGERDQEENLNNGNGTIDRVSSRENPRQPWLVLRGRKEIDSAAAHKGSYNTATSSRNLMLESQYFQWRPVDQMFVPEWLVRLRRIFFGDWFEGEGRRIPAYSVP